MLYTYAIRFDVTDNLKKTVKLNKVIVSSFQRPLGLLGNHRIVLGVL